MARPLPLGTTWQLWRRCPDLFWFTGLHTLDCASNGIRAKACRRTRRVKTPSFSPGGEVNTYALGKPLVALPEIAISTSTQEGDWLLVYA